MPVKQVTFATGTVVSADFLNRIQEINQSLARGTNLAIGGTGTTVSINAGAGDAAACLVIAGKMRYIESPLSISFTGAPSGTYDIWATTTADDTNPAFSITSVNGSTPPAAAFYRLLGSVVWSGTALSGLVIVAGYDAHGFMHVTGADPLPDNSITATQIAAGAVNTSELADGSVTQAKIASDVSLPTANLADGSVTTAKLADDAVTAAKIAANAVGASEIADGSVGNAELAAGSVDSTKIASGGVAAANVAANAISQTSMQDNSVGTAEIINASVTPVKLVPPTVLTASWNGTSLTADPWPGSPVSGQEVRFLHNGSGFAAVIWTFIYYPDAGFSSYPWLWIGGAPWGLDVKTTTSVSTGSYANKISGINRLLVGQFDMTIGARGVVNNGVICVTPVWTGHTATDNDMLTVGITTPDSSTVDVSAMHRIRRELTSDPPMALAAKAVTSAGTTEEMNFWLTPFRVAAPA